MRNTFVRPRNSDHRSGSIALAVAYIDVNDFLTKFKSNNVQRRHHRCLCASCLRSTIWCFQQVILCRRLAIGKVSVIGSPAFVSPTLFRAFCVRADIACAGYPLLVGVGVLIRFFEGEHAMTQSQIDVTHDIESNRILTNNWPGRVHLQI